MKVEEIKKRHKILAQYSSALSIRYENYVEGSLAMCIIFFLLALVVVVLGFLQENYWYFGAALSFFTLCIIFLFITGIFHLLGQLKDISKIILFKMGDHLDEEETS